MDATVRRRRIRYTDSVLPGRPEGHSKRFLPIRLLVRVPGDVERGDIAHGDVDDVVAVAWRRTDDAVVVVAPSTAMAMDTFDKRAAASLTKIAAVMNRAR